MTDDPLFKVREFIATEIEEAEAWTDVPPTYEAGYVSALKVVEEYVDKLSLRLAVGDEAAEKIEYAIAHPEETVLRSRTRRKAECRHCGKAHHSSYCEEEMGG